MRRAKNQSVFLLVLTLVAMIPVPSVVQGSHPGINGPIAFTRYGTENEGNADLVVINNRTGGEQVQIGNVLGFDGSPSWSLFGDKFLFTSERDGNKEIYVWDVREFLNDYCVPHGHPTPERLTFDSDEDDSAVFSPDGSKIAFVRWHSADLHQIWVMNADGSAPVKISEDPSAVDPSWSPDGSKIAFASSRDGGLPEIYVMEPDGSNVERLTFNSATDRAPDWSPDGSHIVFTSNRDGNDEIYVMNADGSSQTNLTNNPELDTDASWSPDGTMIVFSSTRAVVVGETSIYTMNTQGGNVTHLADLAAQPAWGPDTCTDTDDDGIPDHVEILGVRDASGNPVPVTEGLGFPMDPCRKTVAVEIDYMGPHPDGHTHYPLKVLSDGSPNPALEIVMDAFDNAPVEACDCPYEGFPTAPSGVNLVIDISSALPHTADGYAFDQGANCNFIEAKNIHFRPERRPYFHYCIWQHSGDQAEKPGSDFIVSDVKSGLGPPFPDPDPYCIASVFMQELGHNLGLSHGGLGGWEQENYKPNYFSAMNYRYQCSQLKVGDNGTLEIVVDYSREALPTLDETALIEGQGVGPSEYSVMWSGRKYAISGGAIDWNGNGIIDPEPIAFELNVEKKCCYDASQGICVKCVGDPCSCPPDAPSSFIPDQMLRGLDDWHNLTYKFIDDHTGNCSGGAPIDLSDEHPHDLHERNHELREQILSPPTVTAPGDIVVTSNVPTGAVGVELGLPVVSDNDDPAPHVIHDAPGVFPLGSTTVTWTATDFMRNKGTDTQLVTVEPIHVDIDIKPGPGLNTINCRNPEGIIAVAILTTEEFDATTVDYATIVFGAAYEIHMTGDGEVARHLEDVDKDGDVDAVLHFKMGDTNLTCDSEEASLAGASTYGAIVGADEVVMVGSHGGAGGASLGQEGEVPSPPASYELWQNFPNPFNPTTTIRFALPVASSYTLVISDVAGRLVRFYGGSAGAGHVSIVWDGADQSGSRVGSGIYYYKLEAGSFKETKKMVLLK